MLGNSHQSRVIRVIICAVTVFCPCVSFTSCSPTYHHVSRRLAASDVVGSWYLMRDTVRRLKWEGRLTDHESQEYSVVLMPSGECRFHSYSLTTKRLVEGDGHWQLEHGVPSNSDKWIPNVVRISILTGDKKSVESLFITRVGRHLVLWANQDNEWGDRFVIAYKR
jgi:hypothetical protein